MAVALPLMAALCLPGTWSVLVCRFGDMMSEAHDCCAGAPNGDADDSPQIADEPCCSLRAVDLGGPTGERAERADAIHHLALAAAPVLSFLERPAAAPYQPLCLAPRALGPPLRLLKQSFLI